MIDPRKADIGREVIYTSEYLPHDSPGRRAVQERGWISSFNDRYVFVRYHAGSTSAATLRQDLHWAAGTGFIPD